MGTVKTIKQAQQINKNDSSIHFVRINNNIPKLNLKKNDIIKVIDYCKDFVLTYDYCKLYFKNGNYRPITF